MSVNAIKVRIRHFINRSALYSETIPENLKHLEIF